MSNQTSDDKSRIHSFYTLIEAKKIEIPIIQRDYAQGREDEKKLLNRFLSDLKESLKGKEPITLDFIYGNIVKGSFQPIDGQQRLTTLFLLHWYAALKEKVNNTDIAEKLSKLSRFSYENKKSCKEKFCRSLIKNTSKIIFTKEDHKDLSKKIKSSKWFGQFRQHWEKDPTIHAMLRSIDHINSLFFDTHSLWNKLTSNKPKPLITFNYIELEQIGLTDELYIRMNARGRLLTPFEKFKAEFEKYLNSNDNDWDKTRSFKEKFAKKMDTTWTNFFWKYYRKNDDIDSALIRFIATVLMSQIALLAPSPDDKYTDKKKLLKELHDDPENIDPVHFTKDSYNYLRKCFDVYCDLKMTGKDISLDFPLWNHKPVKGDFIKSIIGEASYTQKVLFFAQTEYLLKTSVSGFNPGKFSEWMRVIRNIVSRGCGDTVEASESGENKSEGVGDTDDVGWRPDIVDYLAPEAFEGAIKLVHELAKGCDDIYAFLSSPNLPKRKFNFLEKDDEKINQKQIYKTWKSKFLVKIIRYQLGEEREKAKLISNQASLKECIWECEDNELLRGRIDFVFYCIDYDYSTGVNKAELSSEQESDLLKVQAVFQKHFSKTEKEITPRMMGDLRRAFLTIKVGGEYFFIIIGAATRK